MEIRKEDEEFEVYKPGSEFIKFFHKSSRTDKVVMKFFILYYFIFFRYKYQSATS